MINTPNLHPKLSTTQLQQQNEEAEAWLAKHKPHLLQGGQETFKPAPRNEHLSKMQRSTEIMKQKKDRQRQTKILACKKQVLALCNGHDVAFRKDLAKALGISASTLMKWSEIAEFPKPKTAIRNQYVYDTQEVVEWLEKQKTLATVNCKGLTSNQQRKKEKS